MKIFVTGTRGIPNIPGGIETHCQELYPRMVKMGHEVTIATRKPYCQDLSEWRGIKLKPLYAPRIEILETIVHTFLALFEAKKNKPDILHIHAIGPGLLVPLARAMGFKVVLTNHGPDYEREKWGSLAKKMLKLGEYLSGKYSHKVIAISNTIANIVHQRCGINCTMIPNGLKEVSRTSEVNYLLDSKINPGKYLLAVARFVPEKGLHNLIDAFNKYNNEYQLVIAGDAPYNTNYSQRLKASAARNQNIILTGYVTGDFLNQLFCHAGAFVLPSRHEGFPISMLEALSYKLPILLSNIPAHKEAKLPAVCYFNIEQPQNLELKLKQLIVNLKDGNLSSFDFKDIHSEYDWQKIAEKTISVYSQILYQTNLNNYDIVSKPYPLRLPPSLNEKPQRIAIVHEWLLVDAGAEKVLSEILKIFPGADIYSLLDFMSENDRKLIGYRHAKTSFIQKLPLASKYYHYYLPLMPLAVEQFDLSSYDLVISNNYAVAKGIISGPDQLHISYINSPMRYAWDLQFQYLNLSGLSKNVKGLVVRWLLHKLRIWDVRAAHGVDHFITNSKFISRRVKKTYGRKSTVINPPVDTNFFTPPEDDKPPENFYLTVSRLAPYKRVDILVQTFNTLPDSHLVVIGTGPGLPLLKKISGNNVEILGFQDNITVRDHMRRAKAFLFAAEEDFGIAPLEAQACGLPVIALGLGGASETIIPLNQDSKTDPTGVFFYSQTPDAVASAIQYFEKNKTHFTRKACRDNALSYSPETFRKKFRNFTFDKYAQFIKEIKL